MAAFLLLVVLAVVRNAPRVILSAIYGVALIVLGGTLFWIIGLFQ